MIIINKHLTLNPAELKFSFFTSPGPGGQNVNKVATGVLLRFNPSLSQSLPEAVRERLIALLGPRLTKQGEWIIKATRYRTQESNKEDAIERLCEGIKRAAIVPRKRKATKPTFSSKQKRLETKKIQGKKKTLRRAKPKLEG